MEAETEPIIDPKAFEPVEEEHRYFRLGDKDVLLPASQLTQFDQALLFKLSAPVGGMTLTGEQVTRLKELQSRAIYL